MCICARACEVLVSFAVVNGADEVMFTCQCVRNGPTSKMSCTQSSVESRHFMRCGTEQA
jgi:hypothetical protein